MCAVFDGDLYTYIYFSTYLWHIACFAVRRFVGSITSSDFTKSFASAGVSTNNSSMLGFEFIDFDDWFNNAEPKPVPTDFKSLSLGSGSADTMHSIYKSNFLCDFHVLSVVFSFFLLLFFRLSSVLKIVSKSISTWLIVQLPGNSGLPLHISPSIHPKLHISMPFVYCLFAINISGARYQRVAV